ncbi:GH116 family glycosyl-hydrolase [Snuella sedimenti]|uniref:Twin-arginine translocation signal domain-containing protein n=1 Tax=Snuella sedimenti TaxID=2798802 RepID=A0A8J7J767_9FLAO|nr:GH116 family glycosyl-hydrolase [Snuella sedimenti]MBJ6369854.1 hypothetical protein [Snuella sedimenti]
MADNKNTCDPSTGCCTPDSSTNEPLEKLKMQNKVVETCCETDTCCDSSDEFLNTDVQRRDFMKVMGLGIAGLTMGLTHPLRASEIFQDSYKIPINKNLDPDWIKTLYERGKAEIYTGSELVYIGMPVGGICAGQVYLGGDGKFWLWDIFNDTKEGVIGKTHHLKGRTVRPRDGANYIVPVTPEYPFDQGFAIKVSQSNTSWTKQLNYKGFNDIAFKGQYPVAEVTYKKQNLPVNVTLNAYSPFIPLDVSSSSYPATVMNFTVVNTSNEEVHCELSGWLENPVLYKNGVATEVRLKNTITEDDMSSFLFCEALIDENGSELDFQHKQQRDYGNMSLMLLNDGSNVESTAQEDYHSEMLFPSEHDSKTSAIETFGNSLRGGLSKTVTLQPGEEKDITFVISWYFPNLSADGNRFKGRSYSNRFNDALGVAREIAVNFEKLHSQTLLFRDTFYNQSTLPYWLLNRTFANTSILATETCYLLEDGRFWGWEGIGCCPGTCTHVWHYAQAVGRVFPELERNLRERTDFAVMDEHGKIDFRGGRANRDAADGQAGIVLRSYREHQMMPDNSFLNKNWKHIKLALQYLIAMDEEDGEANGMIYGEQHNTLDAEWYGNIPVITSLYLAALSAGSTMAEEANDKLFARECKAILEKGQKNIENLFNGEFFVQNEDPKHKDAIGIGIGCYIDQVFGQSWAFQLGLGRLYNEEMIQKSLESLWKYNFVPHMGKFRASLPEKLAGRPYAIDSDMGLVMCTWPKGGKRDDWEKHWQFGYFNECMTGFEYEVAGHMIWEGKLMEGLAITKAIHDRYHASKRNPYNEVECSDHYARAMASYGVYLAVCGFKYHGPKKQIAFAPKLTPEDFKAAFIVSSGWGSYSQTQADDKQTMTVHMASGNMQLKQLSVVIPKNKKVGSVVLKLNGKRVKNSYQQQKEFVAITFKDVTIIEDQDLVTVINY